MSGEISPSSAQEAHGQPLQASQRAYVEQLFADVERLPAKVGILDHPSDKEAEFLGRYCSGGSEYNTRTLREMYDIEPLQRPDIIEPSFTSTVATLAAAAANMPEQSHWYTPIYQTRQYIEHQTMYHSRKWELGYLQYIRQRRQFHASFMASLLEPEPDTAALVDTLRSVQRLELPPASGMGRAEPASDFMYNATNWLASSMASALLLPPERCSAAMKRRAIEVFAELADTEQERREPYNNVPTTTPLQSVSHAMQKAIEKQGLLRLPWSMRLTDEELREPYHPRWHVNQVYQAFFGRDGKTVDGLSSFLNKHPKDYVQVLLLRTFTHYDAKEAFNEILATARLAPKTKDVIFAEDASFNTLYDPKVRTLPEHQLGLTELLDQMGEAPSAEALRQIVGQQALQLQAMQGRLTAANQRVAELEQRGPKISYVERPLSDVELLFAKHGMIANIDDEGCVTLVQAVRGIYTRRFHPKTGTTPNADLFKSLNDELDYILRYRNLTEPVAESRQIANPEE